MGKFAMITEATYKWAHTQITSPSTVVPSKTPDPSGRLNTAAELQQKYL